MKKQNFDYFDHEADVGIIGYGKNLNEAFEEGAKAMFNVMMDLENIKPEREIKINAEAYDEEALFVEWLNSLLAYKDIEDMLFSDFKSDIRYISGKYILNGIARGEKIDYDTYNPNTEVKGATYSQLKIEKTNNLYKVQCIVDI